MGRWVMGPVVRVVPIAALALAMLGGPASSSGAAAPLTAGQLAAELTQAAAAHKVPQKVEPPLAVAARAKPLIVLNRCSLQHAGIRSRPCIYGERKSRTAVVLFGDSHAAAWFPALDLISRQQHWRLVVLTKAGCPAAEVNIRMFGGTVPYPECTAWRNKAETQIAALRPSLVIVSGAVWIELEARPEAGVPTGYGSTWLNGLAATFHFLRRSARHVIFISDVPRLSDPAPACLSSHTSDVSQCATARATAVLLPTVRAQEISLAERENVNWIDPVPWFCAPTRCPALVRNLIVYRDDAHMTPAWSRFIAPVLASEILRVMPARRPSGAAAQTLTPARLAADLAAGVKTTRAPRNLDPVLSVASRARPIIAYNGCHLLHPGLRSRPCVYGDRRSHVNVVLFGDSHASAWFPALDRISQQQHWRLSIFTKDGCPPAEVNIAAWFRHGGPYWECTRWRNNAKAQIAALHPALVIVATSTYLEEPEARPEPGVPNRYGSPWKNGMAAIFGFLHRTAQHAIFISDVPTMSQDVPGCVSRHLADVRACTTSRKAARLLPGVRAAEIRLARRSGLDVIDPASWFCTPSRCPVVVGNILLYRDNSHMTPAWSRFIARVLADSILRIAPLDAPSRGPGA